MFCQKCGQELNDDALFCFKCGTETVTGTSENETSSEPVDEKVVESSTENTTDNAEGKTDVKSCLLFVVALIAVVSIAIVIGINMFGGSSSGGSSSVDYGAYESTDKVELSDFSFTYNSLGNITLYGTVESKVDCFGVTINFDVYNDYDRVIKKCQFSIDSLVSGEEYSFNELFEIHSGTGVDKIVITDVMVWN